MNGLGFFGLLSVALQLTIPSYALRLVRRFGTARAGWFVVAAFSALAALYLLRPLKLMSSATASGVPVDLMISIAAVLLVVGMAHIETLLSLRQQAEQAERRVRAECETQAEAKAADLTYANQQLLLKIASLEKAAVSLRESEAEYRFLFIENPQPMLVFDLRSFRFLAVNKAALHQYGFASDEFMALTARDLLPAAGVARFQHDAAKPCSTAQSRGNWQHRRKDGTLIDVEITALDFRCAGYPARLIVASDTGPRREQEKHFFEAQKQEVARQLAGGVAHHFNNTLSIISSHVSLLTHQTHDEKTTEHLNQISTAVNCAAGLSRQLLMASGRFAMREEMVDVNILVRQLQPMLGRLVGKEIALEPVYGTDIPRISADLRLLEHVIVNLVLNARDAMPMGGTLTFRTESVRIGGPAPDEYCPATRAGSFVRLAIRDTGSGMTPEVRAHLFEPFFSTRGVGKGRGLGLASVYGAVNQHSGWIECTSEPGHGTEFRIFLPELPPATKSSETEFRRRMRC
jgi:PAS domain S-box-containing protein